MTPDKTPTEALSQLRHLYANLTNGDVRDTASAKRIAEGLLSPAIAALEKWGSPVVAGGPVAEVVDCSVMGQQTLREIDGRWKFLRTGDKLYATPQPTQAQAGAVPLTQAKVVEAFCALPHQVQFITAFDQGVRFAERHHGIKGGQHG